MTVDSVIDDKPITINLANGIWLTVNDATNLKAVKELVHELKDLL